MKTLHKIFVLSFIVIAILLCCFSTVSAGNDTYIVGDVKDSPDYIDMDKNTKVKFDEKDIKDAKNGKTVTKIVDSMGTLQKTVKKTKNVKKTVNKLKSIGKIKNEKFPKSFKHPVTGKLCVNYMNSGLKKDSKMLKKIDKKTYKNFKKIYKKFHKAGWKYERTYFHSNSKRVIYTIKIKFSKIKNVKKSYYAPKKYRTRFQAELTKGWNKQYPLLIWLKPMDVYVDGTGIDPIPAKYYVDGVLKMYHPGGRI